MPKIHPHAMERMALRGGTTQEVEATIAGGEQFPAKRAGLVVAAPLQL